MQYWEQNWKVLYLITADHRRSSHARFSDGSSTCFSHRMYAGSLPCHRKMQPGAWLRTAPRVSGAGVDRDCACAGNQDRSRDTDRHELLLAYHSQFLRFQNQMKDRGQFRSPKTCKNNAVHTHYQVWRATIQLHTSRTKLVCVPKHSAHNTPVTARVQVTYWQKQIITLNAALHTWKMLVLVYLQRERRLAEG